MYPSTKQVHNTDGNGAVTEMPHKDGNHTRKLCSKIQAQGEYIVFTSMQGQQSYRQRFLD
jgi:hypothetical protein